MKRIRQDIRQSVRSEKNGSAGQQKKIKRENGCENRDFGFRVLRLDESNMEDVYYMPEEYTQEMLCGLETNIKPDRTDLDLLFPPV